jgi:hypothetical protein
MTDQNPQTNGKTHSHQEAPASWNVKYLMQGYDCLLTIRAESAKELLDGTPKVLAWLQANGAEPTRPSYQPASPNGQASSTEPPKMPDGSTDPTWCAIHSIAMKRHEKDGQVWFSHKVGDSYCRGK